jgi:hypothetical protein
MEPLARPSAGSQVSSVPKVFGILSIIFSSLTLLWGLMTSFMVIIPWAIGGLEKSMPGDRPADIDVVIRAMKQVYGGLGGIGLILTVMSALLLAIGIGQIRYKSWARPWTVYWSQAALLSIIGMIAISLMVIGPGYRDLLAGAAAQGAAKSGATPPDMGAFASIFGGTFSGMFVFFYAPYPVLLLAFFTREKVRDAMIY